MKSAHSIAPILVGALMITQGCATASRPEAALFNASQPHATLDKASLTAAKLSKATGPTTLDAVRQLRPDFLRASGRYTTTDNLFVAPVVYENDKYLGDIEQLALIPIAALVEIRRVEAIEAKSQFGANCRCDGGVILVRTQPHY